MTFLRATGLLFWTAVIAVCLIIIGLYLALSQTVLHKPTLERWLTSSDAYQRTVDLVVVPRVIAETRQSTTANKLVTDDLITESLRQTLPASAVRAKAAPATDAFYQWLDGKTPDIEFSIPTKDTKQQFIKNFQKNLTIAAEKLPACNFNTTYDETFDGSCRPTFVTPQAMAEEITKEAENSIVAFDEPLTQSDIPLTDIPQTLRETPNYLNLLWAAALGAGVLLAVAIIWLLTRRIGGLYAIGIGGFAGAAGLYILAQTVESLSLTTSPEIAPLSTVATADIAGKIQSFLPPTALIAILVIILGIIFTVITRQRNSKRRLHFGA